MPERVRWIRNSCSRLFRRGAPVAVKSRTANVSCFASRVNLLKNLSGNMQGSRRGRGNAWRRSEIFVKNLSGIFFTFLHLVLSSLFRSLLYSIILSSIRVSDRSLYSRCVYSTKATWQNYRAVFRDFSTFLSRDSAAKSRKGTHTACVTHSLSPPSAFIYIAHFPFPSPRRLLCAPLLKRRDINFATTEFGGCRGRFS